VEPKRGGWGSFGFGGLKFGVFLQTPPPPPQKKN